jgi:steroid delta-isomerase-like uncharacterized protein
MNLEWAKEWVANFNNVDKCIEMYADDAQFEDVIFAHKENGKDGIRKFFTVAADPAAGEHVFACVGYSGNANAGAVEWTWDGTHTRRHLGVPAKGMKTNTKGVSVLTFKNGKIATQHDYWNAAATLRQLGALK